MKAQLEITAAYTTVYSNKERGYYNQTPTSIDRFIIYSQLEATFEIIDNCIVLI